MHSLQRSTNNSGNHRSRAFNVSETDYEIRPRAGAKHRFPRPIVDMHLNRHVDILTSRSDFRAQVHSSRTLPGSRTVGACTLRHGSTVFALVRVLGGAASALGNVPPAALEHRDFPSSSALSMEGSPKSAAGSSFATTIGPSISLKDFVEFG